MRGWVEELLERLRRSQPASINTIHTFLPSSFSSSSSLFPSSNLQLSVRALLGAYVLAAFTGDLVSKRSTLKKEFTMMRELGAAGKDRAATEKKLHNIGLIIDRLEVGR